MGLVHFKLTVSFPTCRCRSRPEDISPRRLWSAQPNAGPRLEEAESFEVMAAECSHTLRAHRAWSRLLQKGLPTAAVTPRCGGSGREGTILQQSQGTLLWTRPRQAEPQEKPCLAEPCRSWQSRRAGAEPPPLCSNISPISGGPEQAEQAWDQRMALGTLAEKENKVPWGGVGGREAGKGRKYRYKIN